MRDSEIVASIVAGDADGLAEAYDRYADALYGYCRSLLREPADAADAVQDTFVIAASRLTGLRDRELLRPWLYAVARNECLRRLKPRESPLALDEDAEQADENADVGVQAERAETRALLRAAVDGLNPAERDVIIQVLHGLDVAEIAIVLGVSRNHVHSLFSRARQQLEASVAVLLVARSGRSDCQELDAMLGGWDGTVTAALRKRIGRHIDKCTACSGRRRRELTPAMLLSLSPVALLGAIAGHAAKAAHGAAHATAQAAPAAMRDKTLLMASGKAPHAEAYRDALGESHGSFGENGFPKPIRTSHPRLPHARATRIAIGAGAVAAAVVVIAAALSGGPQHSRFAGSGPPPLPGGEPTGQSAPPAPGPVPGTRPGAAPSGVASGGGPGVSASPSGSVSSPSGARSPSPTASAPGSPSPGPTAVSGSPPASPTPVPSRTPTTPAPTPTPTPSGSPAPAPGTLSVSPTSIVLTPLLGSSITLTAENGPVNWSISEPSSLIGELTVSPASGNLGAGQTAIVTVTVSGLASLDTQLTVSPGGQRIGVLLGLG